MRRRLLYHNAAPTVNWYFENRTGQTINYCMIELNRLVDGVIVEQPAILTGGGITPGSNRTGTIKIKELTGIWTQLLITSDPPGLFISFSPGIPASLTTDVTSQLDMYGVTNIDWK